VSLAAPGQVRVTVGGRPVAGHVVVDALRARPAGSQPAEQ
jgi:hypothetical protein